MTDKTIPDLGSLTSIADADAALFIVDSGIQTYKMTARNVGIFFRDQVLPPGLTSPYAGPTAPAGWLLCDGSAVSRTTYLALFTVVGVAYGPGNGSSTFNLPDLRGRVVAGKDDMGGSAANRITNGVSGFDAATLGAAGGSQSYTPGGSIGGSQSIAHVHTGLSHSHNFPHTHMWGFHVGANRNINTAKTSDRNRTTVASGTGTSAFVIPISFAVSGGGANYYADADSGTDRSFYTSGVLDPVSGTTANPETTTSTVNISGMSTNDTVNGVNFTFTGTSASNVQPTFVLNYIIKT